MAKGAGSSAGNENGEPSRNTPDAWVKASLPWCKAASSMAREDPHPWHRHPEAPVYRARNIPVLLLKMLRLKEHAFGPHNFVVPGHIETLSRFQKGWTVHVSVVKDRMPAFESLFKLMIPADDLLRMTCRFRGDHVCRLARIDKLDDTTPDAHQLRRIVQRRCIAKHHGRRAYQPGRGGPRDARRWSRSTHRSSRGCNNGWIGWRLTHSKWRDIGKWNMVQDIGGHHVTGHYRLGSRNELARRQAEAAFHRRTHAGLNCHHASPGD